ncbi:MAG: HpcH/HpaI aldolase/citrate lyase family protein [Gammaproteobacteria bacterium]
MPVFRTMLFAPGNHPRKVEKSLGLNADAVILDLEDAVAIAEKPATRTAIVEALAGDRRCRAYVRVNAFDTPFCYGDLCEVVCPRLDGIVLPKVESAAQLVAIDWLLTQLERDRGMAQGALDLIPIIETGKGVAAMAGIAGAGTRTRRLSFGGGDYTLDMGMRWTLEEAELDDARARVVLASRAAGLEPPVDTVFIHLDQPEMLARSAERVRDMGFQGKLCIHPSQVGPVNAAFTPTDEAVAKARRYVQAFEEAEVAGSASIQVDGFFIDYPIVEQARRTLELVDALEAGRAKIAKAAPR